MIETPLLFMRNTLVEESTPCAINKVEKVKLNIKITIYFTNLVKLTLCIILFLFLIINISIYGLFNGMATDMTKVSGSCKHDAVLLASVITAGGIICTFE